jgi:hypothetical protein
VVRLEHLDEALVKDRTKLLTGCRVCRRKWANEDTSLAALHPELLPELDGDANAPRTADHVKANSVELDTWRCLAVLGHPPYGPRR